MPYLIRRPRIRRVVCLAGRRADLAVRDPASRQAACHVPRSSRALRSFSPFGDTGSYSWCQSGSFEGTAGTSGWSLTGAELTAGNESFHVDGAE